MTLSADEIRLIASTLAKDKPEGIIVALPEEFSSFEDITVLPHIEKMENHIANKTSPCVMYSNRDNNKIFVFGKSTDMLKPEYLEEFIDKCMTHIENVCNICIFY